jgi:hypothetical protein
MKAGEHYWALMEFYIDAASIYDGAEIFLRQFVRVPRRARNLFAAHWCVAVVSNGGFDQFFFNSTGVLAPAAAAALDEIGLPHLARLVAKAMAVLGSEYPRARDERQARLNELGTGADSSVPFVSLRSSTGWWRRRVPAGKKRPMPMHKEPGGANAANRMRRTGSLAQWPATRNIGIGPRPEVQG